MMIVMMTSYMMIYLKNILVMIVPTMWRSGFHVKVRVTKHVSMKFNDICFLLLCLTNSFDLYMYFFYLNFNI